MRFGEESETLDLQYTATVNDVCKFTKPTERRPFKEAFVAISPGDEAGLMDAVATRGPVVIAINATELPSFDSNFVHAG